MEEGRTGCAAVMPSSCAKQIVRHRPKNLSRNGENGTPMKRCAKTKYVRAKRLLELIHRSSQPVLNTLLILTSIERTTTRQNSFISGLCRLEKRLKDPMTPESPQASVGWPGSIASESSMPMQRN